MLDNEYRRKKSELQEKIKVEQARWRNVPGERPDAYRQIRALEDLLEKLEVQYAQDLEHKKVK